MGANTLIGATRRASDLGYSGSAAATSGGRVRCGACGSHFVASAYDVAYELRLEGASDVADSMLLIAGSCPTCGARSTMILGYGPNATAEDADALQALDVSTAQPLPSDDADADRAGDRAPKGTSAS